jgi:uncharacterized cupredoxin-like copper-binding protein
VIRLLIVVAVAALSVIGLASAAGGSDAPRVAVTLAEGKLSVDRPTVPAGKVTFDARNDGRGDHELIVVRSDLAPGKIPVGLEGPSLKLAGPVVLGEPHVHRAHEFGRTTATSRHIRPGSSRRETVRLTPGRYILLCTLPGHYESGQRAGLVVR